jgi:hypothetical protein
MGVNTGDVVTGDLSAGTSVVTGDAVNVAARLEQAAGPGEILLGELTYRLVAGSVTAGPVKPIAAKGKAKRVVAYRLVSVETSAPAPARRLDVLVGRAAELAALGRLFERAIRERRCLLAPVVGEAGVGKSRLVREVSASIGDRATVLAGHCLSYGQGITFWPLAEIVRQAAGITDEHSPQQARERIGRLTPPEVAERVAAIVGLGGEIAAEELGWAVRRLFEALARRAAWSARPRTRQAGGRAACPGRPAGCRARRRDRDGELARPRGCARAGRRPLDCWTKPSASSSRKATSSRPNARGPNANKGMEPSALSKSQNLPDQPHRPRHAR